MVEKVIKCLIFTVLVVVIVGVVFWVAHYMGFPFPGIVEKGVYVIAGLLILLFWWRAFGGNLGSLDPKG